MNLRERFPIHIVTPVRNEQDHLPRLEDAMLSQIERPSSWTILDDGSTDRTPSIISELEKQFDWITGIKIPDRGYYARGTGNTAALKLGFENALKNTDVQALGVFDADISFDEMTMEEIYDAFLHNTQLGVYGGEIVEFRNGEWKPPVVLPEDFVRGACKIYRRKCYEDMGGIITRRGWDSIDNITASMKGWDVKRDVGLIIRHHRPVGSQDGFAVDQYKAGRDAYYMGSDPLLVLARGLRKMVKTKPYFAGGLVFLSAYFGNAFLKKEQYADPELRAYVKKRHRQLLMTGQYKW
ncbi:MAG: glycosyltransferase [Candidatus Roizmanbacteria bacterium]|nr:glycosyltransferase [Candidatus Roizmanbacteria bacterium]